MSRRTVAPTAALSSTSASDRAPSQTRRWLGFTLRQHVAALAIFAAVTLSFFHPLLFGETFSDVHGRQSQTYPWESLGERGKPVVHYDHADSFHPWQVFLNRELRRGEFPLWDPYSFGGRPFFANGQSGTLYPPRLALSFLVSPARVHDLLLVTHFFAAGVAMFLLLGLARLSFPAAAVGGLVWMVNSFALSWQALEHYVAIEVWLPVGFVLAHVAVRGRSWAAALGLALVLGLLYHGGNVLFVELSLVALFGYAIVLAIGELRRERASLGGSAARLGAVAALVVASSAVSSLPVLELAEESAREPLSYDELDEHALSWNALRYLVQLPPVWEGEAYHINVFAGTAIALLALVGLLAPAPLARFAAVLGALTLLFMLHTPVTFAAHAVLPGFDSFKPLARAAFLLQFALAVLAAFGLDQVLRRLRAARPLRLRRWWVAMAALGAVVLAWLLVYFGREPLGTSTIAVVFGLVVAVVVAYWLAAGDRATGLREWVLARLPSAAILLFSLVVAGSVLGQAHILAPHLMEHQPADERHLYPPTPLVRYLQERPQARLLPTELSFNGSTPMIFELRSAGGYESLLPRRTQTFWRVVGDGLSPGRASADPLVFAYFTRFEVDKLRPALLARAGVELVVTAPGERFRPSEADDVELVYDRPDGRVFAVAGAVPRAFLVGACEEVMSPAAALERFVAGFDASDVVVLERPSLEDAELTCSGSAQGEAGTASVSDDSLTSLSVDVDATRDAWLVVTDSWDSDWNATVDGRETDVLPANYAARAVRIPAGTHSVRFAYEPASFRRGAVVSVAALLVLLGAFALVVWRGLSRRRAAPP